MTIEIESGLEWGDSRSQIPQTAEHRAAWGRLADQIEAMHAAGQSVDVEPEVPDIDEA
jgi:hypothetical protein